MVVPVLGVVAALAAVVASVVVLVQSPPDPVAAAPTGAPATEQSAGRLPSPSPTAPAPGAGSAPSTPVPLGTPARVGDYEVAVTAVILDGDAIVAGANEFNEPPTGRYVVVEATARYVGTDEGNPFWDLSYVFTGTDARQYSDSDCSALLPDDAVDAPTLDPGGSASFQVCMDVPPTAIDGGQLFIEPLVAGNPDERVFFSTR
ncbi:DUF4352 domain-containing protein [Geodermatophilus sp. TF02-6]|uniref:DUF4352 domain-containing protein n=1 Tax=Geodermatophilus sp. TF02-6 TaxID=2250575 RepID=UPI0011BEAED1|nr:DUF4352 domain-containing protein [Geodermatophilus sp. TF02-6]